MTLEAYDATPAADLAPISPPDTDSWAAVLRQVSWLAKEVAETDFVPKGLRGSAAAVTAAILYGREIGLPMTALTQVHVVEGRPGLYAEAMRALILAAGHDFEVVEATGATVTVRGRRRGTGRWQPVTWNLDMARAAGLLPANPKSGWAKYPRSMLVARATVELARQLFPDVIHGFRAIEEIQDDAPAADDDAATPAASTTVRRAPRAPRKAATPPPALPATRAPDRPTAPPPLPGEAGYIETPTRRAKGTPSRPPTRWRGHPQDTRGRRCTGAGPGRSDATRRCPAGGETVETPPRLRTPRPRGPGRSPRPPVTDAGVVEAEILEDPEVVDVEETEPPARPVDVRAVRMSFEKRLKITDRDLRLAYTSAIIGREIDTSKKLTRREAGTVLGTLDYCSSVEDLDAAVTAALEHQAATAPDGETP